MHQEIRPIRWHLALQNVKRMSATKIIGLVLLTVLSLDLSCRRSSKEEYAQLQELNRAFGDRFSFELDDRIYLYAKQTKPNPALENDAREIYKFFVFADFEKRQRRNTSVVYLNLYDQGGRFLFQIFYDPNRDRLEKEKTEHY